MLEQILKYHQNLISDEFVQSLLQRIEQTQQRRLWILGIFGCLGLIAAFSAFNGLFEMNWYQAYQQLFTGGRKLLMSAILIMLALTALVVWLFNDEVEFI